MPGLGSGPRNPTHAALCVRIQSKVIRGFLEVEGLRFQSCMKVRVGQVCYVETRSQA